MSNTTTKSQRKKWVRILAAVVAGVMVVSVIAAALLTQL